MLYVSRFTVFISKMDLVLILVNLFTTDLISLKAFSQVCLSESRLACVVNTLSLATPVKPINRKTQLNNSTNTTDMFSAFLLSAYLPGLVVLPKYMVTDLVQTSSLSG